MTTDTKTYTINFTEIKSLANDVYSKIAAVKAVYASTRRLDVTLTVIHESDDIRIAFNDTIPAEDVLSDRFPDIDFNSQILLTCEVEERHIKNKDKVFDRRFA